MAIKNRELYDSLMKKTMEAKDYAEAMSRYIKSKVEGLSYILQSLIVLSRDSDIENVEAFEEGKDYLHSVLSVSPLTINGKDVLDNPQWITSLGNVPRVMLTYKDIAQSIISTNLNDDTIDDDILTYQRNQLLNNDVITIISEGGDYEASKICISEKARLKYIPALEHALDVSNQYPRVYISRSANFTLSEAKNGGNDHIREYNLNDSSAVISLDPGEYYVLLEVDDGITGSLDCLQDEVEAALIITFSFKELINYYSNITITTSTTSYVMEAISKYTDENCTSSNIDAFLRRKLDKNYDIGVSQCHDIIDVATDSSINYENKVCILIEKLSQDLLSPIENPDDFVQDDTQLDLTFDTSAYTGKSASDFWNLSTANNAVEKVAKVTGAVVVGICRAGVGIVKSLFRGVSYLFKKYIQPAFITKDFVKAEGTTNESYVDVPSLMTEQSIQMSGHNSLSETIISEYLTSRTDDISISALYNISDNKVEFNDSCADFVQILNHEISSLIGESKFGAVINPRAQLLWKFSFVYDENYDSQSDYVSKYVGRSTTDLIEISKFIDHLINYRSSDDEAYWTKDYRDTVKLDKFHSLFILEAPQDHTARVYDCINSSRDAIIVTPYVISTPGFRNGIVEETIDGNDLHSLIGESGIDADSSDLSYDTYYFEVDRELDSVTNQEFVSIKSVNSGGKLFYIYPNDDHLDSDAEDINEIAIAYSSTNTNDPKFEVVIEFSDDNVTWIPLDSVSTTSSNHLRSDGQICYHLTYTAGSPIRDDAGRLDYPSLKGFYRFRLCLGSSTGRTISIYDIVKKKVRMIDTSELEMRPTCVTYDQEEGSLSVDIDYSNDIGNSEYYRASFHFGLVNSQLCLHNNRDKTFIKLLDHNWKRITSTLSLELTPYYQYLSGKGIIGSTEDYSINEYGDRIYEEISLIDYIRNSAIIVNTSTEQFRCEYVDADSFNGYNGTFVITQAIDCPSAFPLCMSFNDGNRNTPIATSLIEHTFTFSLVNAPDWQFVGRCVHHRSETGKLAISFDSDSINDEEDDDNGKNIVMNQNTPMTLSLSITHPGIDSLSDAALEEVVEASMNPIPEGSVLKLRTNFMAMQIARGSASSNFGDLSMKYRAQTYLVPSSYKRLFDFDFAGGPIFRFFKINGESCYYAPAGSADIISYGNPISVAYDQIVPMTDDEATTLFATICGDTDHLDSSLDVGEDGDREAFRQCFSSKFKFDVLLSCISNPNGFFTDRLPDYNLSNADWGLSDIDNAKLRLSEPGAITRIVNYFAENGSLLSLLNDEIYYIAISKEIVSEFRSSFNDLFIHHDLMPGTIETILNDPKANVCNTDFIDLLYSWQVNHSTLPTYISNFLKYVITNKPLFVKWYYILFNQFPSFFPYSIGNRLESAKWHISTDAENEKYCETFISVLVVAALAIAAAVVVGITTKKLKTGWYKRKAKIEATKWRTTEDNANIKKSIKECDDKIDDLKAQINELKSDKLGNKDAISSLKQEIKGIQITRKNLNNEFVKGSTKLAKILKKERKLDKLAERLGLVAESTIIDDDASIEEKTLERVEDLSDSVNNIDVEVDIDDEIQGIEESLINIHDQSTQNATSITMLNSSINSNDDPNSIINILSKLSTENNPALLTAGLIAALAVMLGVSQAELTQALKSSLLVPDVDNDSF